MRLGRYPLNTGHRGQDFEPLIENRTNSAQISNALDPLYSVFFITAGKLKDSQLDTILPFEYGTSLVFGSQR